MPLLTDTWAAVYLQILFGTLFFALGIPAFILQLVVNEDIRHVTERRMQSKWWSGSIWLIGVAAVAFIWLLHPTPEVYAPKWKALTGSLIVTLVPLSVAYFGLRFLGTFRRETVIRDLTGFLTYKYNRPPERRYNKLVKNGYYRLLRVGDHPFQDLKYLGERGMPGYEKQLVLTAYREIASALQNGGDYKGEELTELIKGLLDILENRSRPGDGENYSRAAELLKMILYTHSSLNQSMHHHLVHQDADAVIRTLTELGLASIKSQRDVVVLKILNIGASCSSLIVFKMGISALRAGRFLIATNALNKLEADVESEAAIKYGGIMAPGDAASRLLGVISHFVAEGGAARARGQTFFRNQNAGFFSHLDECLREAFDYHYSRTDFETADKIAALRSLTGAAHGTTRQKKRLAN